MSRWWIRALNLVCVLTLGCDPQLYTAKSPKEESARSRDGAETSPGGMFANPAVVASLFGNILKNADEPGPFDEPIQSPQASETRSHHAILELSGTIAEREPMWSLLDNEEVMPLRALTKRIQTLAGDERVEAVLLRFGALDLSFAAAEELFSTLAAQENKPIHCYFESASDRVFLVLAACRTITIAPSGSLDVFGPSLEPIYFKGLLGKLGVIADFIHVGAYKGAAEPFTRSEPSPEMRETLNALLDGAYERLVDAVARGRHVDVGKARSWVDTGLFTAEGARASGLIDGVDVFEDWRASLVKDGEWRKADLLEKKLDLGGFLEMLGGKARKEAKEPHIALFYAVGEIVHGEGDGLSTDFRGAPIDSSL